MDPNLRTFLLAGGLAFCGLFGAMTVAVALEYGVDVFTFAAAAILLMLMLALIGALRNPPD
jgi:heme A synthase